MIPSSNNPTARLSSTENKEHRRLLPFFITAVCAFLLGHQTKILKLYTTDASVDDFAHLRRYDAIPGSTGDRTSGITASTHSVTTPQHQLGKEDEADYIIRKSYLNSYAHILPCNNSTKEKDCLTKTLNHFKSKSTRTTLPPVPWWFKTLLRDVVSNGAYGFWHHLSTTDPPLNFCTIEKVGTTEWRRVFCDMNENECPNVDGKYPSHCVSGLVGRKCAFQTKKTVPSDAPKAVFLRDPLERLLSAFLDKCVKPGPRKQEKHCEPNEVYNTEGWGKRKISPTKDFEDDPKQFFAAYLDTMPLAWNVHFLPQAIYCDLYRTINTDFAFIGDMGKEFMVDLERMANQFKGRLPYQLDKTFGYKKGMESKRLNNTGSNKMHATHAPAKVAQYYNADSVRKALQYMSIDYVTLGLDVPEWAIDMLRNETL